MAPRLSIRIYLDDQSRVGPGKIALLEAIAETGSIAAAGRKLGMSYRRAWGLLAEMNQMFPTPVHDGVKGGKSGGGAVLTPLGRRLVEAYRQIESATYERCATELQQIQTAAAHPSE